MKFEFPFPAKTEPTWSKTVDRWYQLDAYAYGLAEFYSQNKSVLGKHPDFILLASSGASNETDREFAAGGACSPAKFVHTLPNIRVSPMLQVMEHACPVLCLQNDPQTRITALEEAHFLLSEFPCIWVLSIEPENPETKTGRQYSVDCSIFTRSQGERT